MFIPFIINSIKIQVDRGRLKSNYFQICLASMNPQARL